MDVLAEDGSAWRREFTARVRPFRARWRRGRLLHRALVTLWLPVLGTAVLLALLRFTLVDLPQDEQALWLPWLFWVLSLAISYLLDRPSLARLALAIDTQLDLDERLSTALALSHTPAQGPAGRLVRRQRVDALQMFADQGSTAIRAFRAGVPQSRRPLIAAAALALLLVPLLFLPSPVAGQRAELAALRVASAQQADRLAALRRELVARPDLSPAERDLLAAQLAGAEASLRAHPTDRAANVAALTQADDALHSLLPQDATQVRAARIAAAQALQNSLAAITNDSPTTLPGSNDLEKAAAAATNATEIGQLASGRRAAELALAGRMDQIADSLENTDPALAATIRQTADALRQGGAADAPALNALAQTLQSTAQAQAAADVLSDALGQVDDSKQQVGQAGLPEASDGASVANRPFGRRSPDAGTDGAGNPTADGQSAGTNTGGDSSNPAGAGQGAGQPDGANGGPGSDPATGANTGGSGTAGGPGNTALGSNVQGGGGTKDGAPDQTGTGNGRVSITGTDQPSSAGSGAFEPVYVPGSAPAQAQGGPQDKIPGVQSPGQDTASDTTVIQNGPGYKPGVKTPYNKVIGQYQDAAAQALDHTVIPADAKQYVRDYFDSLAPSP